MHSEKVRLSVFQQRQLQAERGALAHHAFAADTPAMAFHDGLDHGQPQPQAIAALGRFEADEGMVSADQSLLTRALFNVLENAIKYSPSGTTVRLRHGTTEGWLECRISDQGPGIAAEDLPELFSQYRRFESAQGSDGLRS